MSTINLKLNLVPGESPGGVLPSVRVSQGDDTQRILRFELFDGDEAADLTGVTSAYVGGKKPDGYAFTCTCTLSGNIGNVPLSIQSTACAGRVRCKLFLIYQNGSVRSAAFDMNVDEDPLSDADYSGSEVPDIVERIVGYVEDAEASAASAAASATSAAASATSAASSSDSAGISATEARNAAINAATETVNAVSALLSDKVRQAKSWATYANDPDSYGNDYNNSHFWSDRAHSYYVNTVLTNERFLEEIEKITTEALNRVNSIHALINLMYGSVYMVTENGDNLVAQNGDKLIISY